MAQEENKVILSRYSLDDMVQKVDPDDTQIAYQFANGRKFEDSGASSGIYLGDPSIGYVISNYVLDDYYTPEG